MMWDEMEGGEVLTEKGKYESWRGKKWMWGLVKNKGKGLSLKNEVDRRKCKERWGGGTSKE